jgi:hypothetical protein
MTLWMCQSWTQRSRCYAFFRHLRPDSYFPTYLVAELVTATVPDVGVDAPVSTTVVFTQLREPLSNGCNESHARVPRVRAHLYVDNL